MLEHVLFPKFDLRMDVMILWSAYILTLCIENIFGENFTEGNRRNSLLKCRVSMVFTILVLSNCDQDRFSLIVVRRAVNYYTLNE